MSKPPPSPLADLFTKHPRIADLVVRELDPVDTVDLMTKTEPALFLFCQGSEGGLDRLVEISRKGTYGRRMMRKMPSLPRLLEGEWRGKLLGKRLVAEEAQGDDGVGLSLSLSLSHVSWVAATVFQFSFFFLTPQESTDLLPYFFFSPLTKFLLQRKTFKRSDIPEPSRIGHSAGDCAFHKNRSSSPALV